MAQSLVCKDCNTFLRSVKDAEAHAETTGHTNFEESEEKLTMYTCSECGKACRSVVEKELHEKRTGHAEFVEVEGSGVNTEYEMKKLRNGDENDGAEDGTSTAGGLVEPEVNQESLDQLMAMGFSKNKSTRALYFSGDCGIDAAVEWISSQTDEKEMEEALLVPNSAPKLTPEEAKAKAQELIQKAKERREAEEKERERLREQERIRAGKEMAAVARKEEEQRLKRIAEERMREKQEEARAREKIRQKLEQDRMERRAAMGLPPELTEEEKEEERQRQQDKAEKEARMKLPVKPYEKSDNMRNALVSLKKANASQDAVVHKCFSTLLKLVSNPLKSPDNPKFRRINLSNPAITDRVGRFPEAVEFLMVCGFQKTTGEDGTPTLQLDEVDHVTLQVAVENLDSAINNPFFGML